MAYRRRFGDDVVIDLVGYRRFGHNEQDEAAYTQPLMVEQIQATPRVRELYAAAARRGRRATRGGGGAARRRGRRQLREAHERLKASFGDAAKAEHDGTIPAAEGEVSTAVPADRLRELERGAAAQVPDGFTVHPKLARQLERRRTRSTRAASTGARPSPSRSRRCWSTGSRCV